MQTQSCLRFRRALCPGSASPCDTCHRCSSTMFRIHTTALGNRQLDTRRADMCATRMRMTGVLCDIDKMMAETTNHHTFLRADRAVLQAR